MSGSPGRVRPGHSWGTARRAERPRTVADLGFLVQAVASLAGTDPDSGGDIEIGLSVTARPRSSVSDHSFALAAESGIRLGGAAAFVLEALPGGGPVATYANGYPYRRRIVLAPQPDLAAVAPTGEVLIDFPYCLSAELLSGTWLKPLASGGRMASTVPAPGAAYLLTPAVGTNFALHKLSAAAAATQRTDGILLTGGPAGDSTTGSVAEWSRARSGPVWAASLDTVLVSSVSPIVATDERLLQFYWGAVGDGTTGAGGVTRPADVSAWTVADPFSHNYRAHLLKGARITFYFKTPADGGDTKAPSVAWFDATDVAHAVAQEQSPEVACVMATGVVIHWDLSFDGLRLSARQTLPDGTSKAFSYLLPAGAADPAAGNFGLQTNDGVVVQVRNLRITTPTDEIGPRDLRFELEDGTKLDHWCAAYDPVAGTAGVFARIPSYNAGVALRLLAYYGRAGLAATEANPSQALRAAAAVRTWPFGLDLTGKGKTMAPRGVVPATIARLPGGSFAPISKAATVNPAVGDGATRYALVQLIRLAALTGGNIHRQGGTQVSTASLSTFLDEAAPDGTSNVYETGANAAVPPGFTSRRNVASFSASDVPVVGETRLLVAGLTFGTDPFLFLDDDQLATGLIGSNTTGGRVLYHTAAAGGVETEEVGAGSGAQNTSVVAVFGPNIILPFAPSARWVAMFARSVLTCLDVAGLGPEDQPGEQQGPTAVPLRADVSGRTDIDVLPSAVDPDNPTLTLQLAGQPAGGTLSVVAGKLRDDPVPAFSGVDRLPFQVTDGLKSSRSLVYATVKGATGGTFWADPNIAGKTAYPGTIDTVAELDSALAAIDTSTQYIVLTGRLPGPIAVTRGGNSTHPLVIMARTSDRSSFGGRAGVRGSIRLVAPWVWLYQASLGLSALGNTPGVSIEEDDCFVTRCQVDSPRGIASLKAARSCLRCNVGFNRMTGPVRDGPSDEEESQILLKIDGGGSNVARPDFWHIYFNHFTQDVALTGNETHGIYSAAGHAGPIPHTNVPNPVNILGTIAEYNLFTTMRARALYMKHGMTARFNDIRGVATPGSTTATAGTGRQGVSFRGETPTDGKIMFNRMGGYAQLGIQGWRHTIVGNELYAGAELYAFCHCDNPADAKTLIGANFSLIAGNKAKLHLGYSRADLGFSAVDPLENCTVEAHVGDIVNDNLELITPPTAAPWHPTGINPNLANASTIIRPTTSQDLTPSAPTLNAKTSSPDSLTTGPVGLGRTWGS